MSDFAKRVKKAALISMFIVFFSNCPDVLDSTCQADCFYLYIENIAYLQNIYLLQEESGNLRFEYAKHRSKSNHPPKRYFLYAFKNARNVLCFLLCT